MSGGLAVKTKKRVGGAGRSERASDYPARVFCPKSSALTARGPQAPNNKKDAEGVNKGYS